MIAFRRVSKRYGPFQRGAVALRELDLEVPPGTALGVLGPNGAGKSTLLRLILGYLRPSEGEVSVFDEHPRAYVERYGIGYVPERISLPRGWTVRRALRGLAALGELPDAQAGRVEERLRELGLDGVAGRRLPALSKGMLQRLALAQALLADRSVLVLDEPFDGLDPLWRDRAEGMVRGWRESDPGRILIVASHDVRSLERMTDRAVILVDGGVRTVTPVAGGPPLPPSPLEAAFRDAMEADR